MEVNFENFIQYFENFYRGELASKIAQEEKHSFLKALKKMAEHHRFHYELRHGKGSYQTNLAKYGNLKRTPLQMINGDLNTHLLCPTLSHSYSTIFGYHIKARPINTWQNVKMTENLRKP